MEFQIFNIIAKKKEGEDSGRGGEICGELWRR